MTVVVFTIWSFRNNKSGMMLSHALLCTVMRCMKLGYSVYFEWNAKIHRDFTA
jgi:hypothetical protein